MPVLLNKVSSSKTIAFCPLYLLWGDVVSYGTVTLFTLGVNMSQGQEESEMSEHPDVQVEVHPPGTPTREVQPVTFFQPGADHTQADMDFRPTAIAFKDDDADHPAEDGHGNFTKPTAKPPVHPSEKRKPQPYLESTQDIVAGSVTLEEPTEDTGQTEEPADAPDDAGDPKQDSPFGP